MTLSRFVRCLGTMVVLSATVFAQLKVGEATPDKTFGQMINTDGRKSMAELKGSPILIDWWGNH